MPIVQQLTKKLSARPTLPQIADVHLRHYAGRHDIPAWLELRRRAFSRQKVSLSDWDTADFEREFLEKPWWQPQAMWLAEMQRLMMPREIVGTVTLARRGGATDDKPVVHWLAVLPRFRRLGIGHLLMASLEAAVWDGGERQIWLETHEAWVEAARLYRSLGYEPVSRESNSQDG